MQFFISMIGLLGLVALTGCVILPEGEGSAASTIQYFEAEGSLEGTGVGFAGYWIRENQPGVFLQLQTLRNGVVGGEELSDLPSGSGGDPVTGQEQLGWCLSAGTTWEINETCSIHAGLGLGFSETWQEQFDSDLILGSAGFYNTSNGQSFDLEACAGAMFKLGNSWVLDTGYNTFSEALYLGLGYSY
ncbi:MAG: hypothetical protein P8K66_09505 [Planctomycetota bacterium]|nr:hypothetical protein [Planctomycetota bacterium]